MLGTLDFTDSEHCPGPLQFLLEYSLEWKSKNTIVPLLLDRMPLHASEGEIHLY